MGYCTARGFELLELKALQTPARQASDGGEIVRCHRASAVAWQEGCEASGALVSLQAAGGSADHGG